MIDFPDECGIRRITLTYVGWVSMGHQTMKIYTWSISLLINKRRCSYTKKYTYEQVRKTSREKVCKMNLI